MIEMLVCISQYSKERLMRCILKNDSRKISLVFPSCHLSRCISVKAETIIMVRILWFINVDYLGSEMENWAGGQNSLPTSGVIACTVRSGHGVCVEPGLQWSPEVWHGQTLLATPRHIAGLILNQVLILYVPQTLTVAWLLKPSMFGCKDPDRVTTYRLEAGRHRSEGLRWLEKMKMVFHEKTQTAGRHSWSRTELLLWEPAVGFGIMVFF